jgi:hypothetical protein
MLLNGRVFIPSDEVGKKHWRIIAVQVEPKPDNYPGTEIFGEQMRVSGYIVLQFNFLDMQLLLKTMPSSLIMTGVLGKVLFL